MNLRSARTRPLVSSVGATATYLAVVYGLGTIEGSTAGQLALPRLLAAFLLFGVVAWAFAKMASSGSNHSTAALVAAIGCAAVAPALVSSHGVVLGGLSVLALFLVVIGLATVAWNGCEISRLDAPLR